MENETPELKERIEITGTLSRQVIEAIYLEIRELAKRHGARVREFRIERAADAPIGARGDQENGG